MQLSTLFEAGGDFELRAPQIAEALTRGADLGSIEAALHEAQHLARLLESAYRRKHAARVSPTTLARAATLHDAVLACCPDLVRIEADLLDEVRERRAEARVSAADVDRVAYLRGRALRVVSTLERGLIAALEATEAEA